MTTTVKRAVQNVITKPGGGVEAGRLVSIQLNVGGFVDGGHREVLRTAYATTDDTGLWSCSLEVTSGIDPVDTYYTVREMPGVIWAFQVPDGSGAVWLRDCLVDAPPNTDPIVTASSVPGGGTTGQVLAKLSNADFDDGWVNQSGGGGGFDRFDIGAVQTSAFTATVEVFWPVDTTAGPITATLPTTPADKAQVQIKAALGDTDTIDGFLADPVTIICGGSDVLDSGDTSMQLVSLRQGAWLQYDHATATWTVLEESLSYSQLEHRLLPTSYIDASIYGWSPDASDVANLAAFDQALAASKEWGLPLYLGTGNYNVSSSLDCRASASWKEGLKLFAAGRALCNITVTDSTAGLILVGGFEHWFYGFGMAHSGTAPDGSTGDGMVWYKLAYSVIERMQFTNCGRSFATFTGDVHDPGTNTGSGNFSFSNTFNDNVALRYSISAIDFSTGNHTGCNWNNTYIQNKKDDGTKLSSSSYPLNLINLDESHFNQTNIEDSAGQRLYALCNNTGTVTFTSLHFERTDLNDNDSHFVEGYGLGGPIITGLTVAFCDLGTSSSSGNSTLVAAYGGGTAVVTGILVKECTKTRSGTTWTLGESNGAGSTIEIGTYRFQSNTTSMTAVSNSTWPNLIRAGGWLAAGIIFDDSGCTIITHTSVQDGLKDLDTAVAGKQPLDADLTTIAGLTATTDSFMQAKGSAWAARTIAQVKTDLNLAGSNTGDQTLPVGGTPAVVLGTTAAAGVSPNFLRRDDTIVAFDATAPSTQAFGDAAAAGAAAVAARRDHKHAMPATPKDTTAATGLLKGNGSTVSAATPGTDYYNPGGTDVALADGGTGGSTAAAARTNLGLVVGTDVQAHDTDLDTIAGLTATTDSFLQSKASAWAARTIAQVKADLGLTGTNSGDQTITLTGDATGSGTGSFATTVVKINGTTLSGLATGLLKNTTATGVPSIAAAGTDYLAPAGNGSALTGITESQIANLTTDLAAKAALVETVAVVATSGSTQTIPDPGSAATISRITLTANCTFTFPTAAAGKSLTIFLVQDATGSRTATWPATVKWPGATAPTLTTTAAHRDAFTFVCTDGTNWDGFTAGLNYA